MACWWPDDGALMALWWPADGFKVACHACCQPAEALTGTDAVEIPVSAKKKHASLRPAILWQKLLSSS